MQENKKNPKISVIMPNYNCERYIGEAIESVLNQSFTDFEFIIIDDGSTDNSWNIIQEYAKKNKCIIAIKNENNLKICKTLNKGLQISKGEYIARMDSDDIAKKEWIERIYSYISKHSNIGICGSNFDVINKKGDIIFEKKFPNTNIDCKNAIWFRNPFAHNTVLFRKKCFNDFGGYDKDFLYAEDLELWIRFGQKYDFYNIQENLVQYRIYGENSILKKQKIMIRNTLKARKKAIKLGYKVGVKGIIYYIGTWFMQFFPPKFVLWLFNKLNK
ncbi:MAG: glycosyltransferase [Candidatus Gracilibacteria bacterium]|nr:glycosyltransferase [Candidatus Gracilibacteria bacterium]